ncbi:MAG: glutamate-1-semialdehyde 2,1-aminomutase [Verrucomicrobia bacterium]|nr:glutamate-1-semialdehyde 2,1-aminomutase [Verrucomicrobiota bacterium]
MTHSPSLRARAEAVMPGGVNSPVRAFRSVGGEPIYARRAEGAILETVDGRRLTDFCMSFGPLILGHAHPDVTRAIAGAAARGTSYAVTTEAEVEMAETIRDAIPSVEKVRLMSSGTEACMTAVRLARGATGRNKILKFSGCYHGHADGLLVRAGSGVAGLAAATSAGIPASYVEHTLVARYNHIDDVERIVAEFGTDLAAIIVEPVAANVGLLRPRKGFLREVRDLAARCGALLIFDEVITGFRLTFGSYQTVCQCGLRPDLVCLGKIIGGGLPVGALGGRAELMDRLAPLGPVYQAGTLSGNPVSVAAGLAALRRLKADAPYDALARRTEAYVGRIAEAAKKAGVVVQIPTIGSIFSLFFMDRTPESFEDIQQTNAERYKALFHSLLKDGVYLPPSPFEVSFLSTAHDDALLAGTLPAWDRAFVAAARAG